MVKFTSYKCFWEALIFLSLFVFASCTKDEVITGEEIITPAFSEIVLSSSFDVVITQDTTYSIRFEAAEVFFGALQYEVKEGVLYVYSEKSPRWRNPEAAKPKVYITSNRPKLIKALETCNITSTNPIISNEFGLIMASKLNYANLELDCKVFYYWNNHPCGGRIRLWGQTEQLKIWNYAIMAVDASECESDYALVENHSKGIVSVWTNEKFEYRLSGSGNIELKGNPPILNEITPADGSGQLIKID